MNHIMRNILVACDFTPFSLDALKFAREMAAQTDATVHVMHVIEYPFYYETTFGVQPYWQNHNLLNELTQQANEKFANLEKATTGDGVRLKFYIERGNVDSLVAEKVEELDIDLVVMDARGHNYRDVMAAAALAKTNLFRPPFGRLTPRQGRMLQKQLGLDVVMWSITTGDFDSNISPMRCLNNVLKHVYPGAIVLLHDNPKAAVKLRFVLPKILAELTNEGYRFSALPVKQEQFAVPEEGQSTF